MQHQMQCILTLHVYMRLEQAETTEQLKSLQLRLAAAEAAAADALHQAAAARAAAAADSSAERAAERAQVEAQLADLQQQCVCPSRTSPHITTFVHA